MHKSWAIIKMLKGSISEKIAIGTAKRAIRANIIAKLGTIPVRPCNIGLFGLRCLRSVCEIVLPTGSGEHFFHKMATNAMRKCQSFALSAYDKADTVKYGFPKGTISKKCTFF